MSISFPSPRILIHACVDLFIPKSYGISIIAFGAGWYANQVSMVKLPNIINDWVYSEIQPSLKNKLPFETVANMTATVASPIITNTISPYACYASSLGVSLATSFTLNLLSIVFFGIIKKINDIANETITLENSKKNSESFTVEDEKIVEEISSCEIEITTPISPQKTHKEMTEEILGSSSV